jgi:toxin-antitoxin system PIN domain toxin
LILLDVNVLVAAHRDDHPQHQRARVCLDALVAGDETFSAADTTWASFVRIATNRRIFPVPTPLDDAFDFLRAVRAQPGYVAIAPGRGHLQLFERLCHAADATGDLAADAYLAAIAVEMGCTLVSFDRDFARFPGLRWELPS